MAQAIKTLWGVVKAAALFIILRPKDAAFVILAILCVFMLWRLRRERSHALELIAKIEGLPPGINQAVTVYRDRVITKWRTGPSKVEYRERYLPPEGHVEIVTKENASDKPPEVVVKDWGFTARLGGGMVYSGKVLPVIDLKWFYWGRYSLTIGVTPQCVGIGISRHVDNFMPFENVEILGITGINWTGDPQFGCGMRFNF